MTPIEVLQKTRDLLAQPYRWGKHADIRIFRSKKLKEPVQQFCLTGALGFVAYSNTQDLEEIELNSASLIEARKALSDEIGDYYISDFFKRESYNFTRQNIISFNDDLHTKKKDILNIIDRSIERLSDDRS